MKNLHAGSVIKQIIKEEKIKISDFARAIHCSRSNVYSLFERESLDTKRLSLISKVLGHNFTKLYSNYDSQKNNHEKYLVLLEIDQPKLQELSSDEKIKLVYSQKVSE